MHILQIASGDFFSTYGGGQVYVKNIVDELVRQGAVKISILSYTGNADIQKKTYRTCDLYESGELSDEDFAQLLKEIGPDIIHAHSHKPQACSIGKKLHIPVVVTAHHGGIVCPAGALLNSRDDICQTTITHRNCLRCVLRNTRTGLVWYPMMRLLPERVYITLGKILERLPFILFVTPIGRAAIHIQNKHTEWQTIVNNCALMIAPCEAIKEAMVRNGLSEDNTRVVPHGIPLPQQIPSFPSIQNGVRFFYVGRICYAKGIHIMLEAFHKLTSPKAELHLIGESDNKAECRYKKKLQTRFRQDPRIVWHGKTAPETIFTLIKDYHISIAPSVSMEAFGLSIAESLANGKPVVATCNGGAEMQIRNGENGWLIPTNDIDALHTAMQDITEMSDSELFTMSANCHAHPIADHCKRLCSIYVQVAQHVSS